MRAGVRFVRPEHLAEHAGVDRLDRFQGLGRVDQVFEVAVEDTHFFYGFQNFQRLAGGAGERLGTQDGLAGLGGHQHLCRPRVSSSSMSRQTNAGSPIIMRSRCAPDLPWASSLRATRRVFS